jgi:His/Glu/Gln/Arg/opine family amino acid ABC transporter permease subunit
MASAAAGTGTVRPERGLSWMLSQSTKLSLGIVALGILSLFLVAAALFVVLPLQGITPAESLIEGFRSPGFQGTLLAGVIIGVIAVIAGVGTFRRMPTKTSRGGAISGAVLGGQGILLGLGLYLFARGDRVDVFVINYFNFDQMDGNYGAFVRGFWNTIRLAATSEFLGIILGLFLAVLAISKRSVVRAPARAYINFFRGTPLVWQISFIGIAVPIALQREILTYTAAITALSLNAGAYIAEVFRAGIQSIERGQFEAARGLGMSYLQAMRYAIVPQAVRRVIPPLMNEFVILVKDTSLVFVLGLTATQRDLFAVGSNLQQNNFNATYLIFTALGYLAVCLPAIRVVNWIEKKLRSGLVGISG